MRQLDSSSSEAQCLSSSERIAAGYVWSLPHGLASGDRASTNARNGENTVQTASGSFMAFVHSPCKHHYSFLKSFQ
eukprot:6260326-Amphidinium_carterae.3